jgi:hypothetical protein
LEILLSVEHEMVRRASVVQELTEKQHQYREVIMNLFLLFSKKRVLPTALLRSSFSSVFR